MIWLMSKLSLKSDHGYGLSSALCGLSVHEHYEPMAELNVVHIAPATVVVSEMSHIAKGNNLDDTYKGS